jgi:uncharacterized protein YjbI with pentapeptide repeats
MPGAALVKDGVEEPAMSQAGLARIMEDHRRYRSGQRGARANLRFARLDGLSLAHHDLSEADLSGASLVGADLRGANFSRASLYCADLRDCDLRNACLEQADLRGASFKGANLAFAFMDHADLRAATMLYMGDTIRFQGNSHEESPFGAVDFSNSSLRNVSFRNARLDNADFTDALLQGAVFRGARLKNPCFRGAVLAGADLEDVPPQALSRCLPAPSPAARARAKGVMKALTGHHEWFVSAGRKGRPANIEGEDLRPLEGSLKGLCLAGLCARNVVAVSLDFSGCQLQAAKFDGADLRGASFADADLSGASFQDAKLAHAGFRNARIRDLVLCTGYVLHFQANRLHGAASQFRDALAA